MQMHQIVRFDWITLIQYRPGTKYSSGSSIYIPWPLTLASDVGSQMARVRITDDWIKPQNDKRDGLKDRACLLVWVTRYG